ncbi:MAG: succinate dehydrogenase cytochrome b subunit [Planctomycetota bacterium]
MRILRFLNSSIGAKVTMAVTGLALSGFVVGHLTGNLLVFSGREAMNDYAQWLKSLGGGLWIARGGLLAMFILHIATAIKLKRGHKQARPVGYAYQSTIQASQASRTMILSGLLVLGFVLMHLMHFTFRAIGDHGMPEEVLADGTHRHDVFGMLVAGFENDLYVAVYTASMIVLGSHLSHGLHSLFQSLGLRHEAYTPLIEKAASAVAWLLALGFLTIPWAVRLGFVSAEPLAQ